MDQKNIVDSNNSTNSQLTNDDSFENKFISDEENRNINININKKRNRRKSKSNNKNNNKIKNKNEYIN